MLNPKATDDIIDIVTGKCGVRALGVRVAITSKCVENKLMRHEKVRYDALIEQNNEQ